MGVLGRFEKGIERAVNGAFARAFRSEVQPVELASAIKREADDNASVVGVLQDVRRELDEGELDRNAVVLAE